MYGSLTFFHPAILQFLMSDISFNTACKELKIAQIAQLNLLHLAHIYGHGFYWVSCMLLSKNVNNDVRKASPIEDTEMKLNIKTVFFERSDVKKTYRHFSI